MTATLRCVKYAIFVLALSLLGTQASATIYIYTGQNYSLAQVDSGAPPDVYTTSDRLTGFVEFAAPLAANLPIGAVTPLSYSFSDGVNTATNLSVTGAQFFFATGPSGEIVQWAINLTTFRPLVEGHDTISSSFTAFSAGDVAQDTSCGPGSNSSTCFVAGSYNQFAASLVPGQWAQQAAVVPEPASLALLGAGLLVLAARRRGR